MLRNLWRKNPVIIMAVVLLVVMLVQKIWVGELITEEWIEWALGLVGLGAGAGILRQSVYSKHTVEDK